ncbi:hypothetical protein, partial [Escherichia coli]|uniref:hypothetical protein n=1 Tax=Escherichia coli TaxID=562 RepID=UPI001BAE9F57
FFFFFPILPFLIFSLFFLLAVIGGYNEQPYKGMLYENLPQIFSTLLCTKRERTKEYIKSMQQVISSWLLQ